MTWTVQCVNKAPFERNDVVTCIVPLAQGELSNRSTELRANDTGYLGAGVAERVQWYPYGDDVLRNKQHPALYPDGSFKYIKVSFPVTLPAATGTTPNLFGRRTVTIEVGQGTVRTFQWHPDVLLTLSTLEAALGLQISGQAFEEVSLDLWSVVQSHTVIEGNDVNACRKRYRVFQRLRPRNDANPDVRHCLYADIVFDIYSNMRHIEMWFAWGNGLIQRKTDGTLYGTALGPYAAGRIINFTGPVFLRIKNQYGNASFPHFDLRSWGNDTYGRQTQADGTAYFLLQPTLGLQGNRIGHGQRRQYKGVLYCGTPDLDDTERAERWCPSNATTRGGNDALGVSTQWPGRNPPYFVVADYPDYITNNFPDFREETINRIEVRASQLIEQGGENNPYATSDYLCAPNPGQTGNQGGFAATRGWTMYRSGWPGELPALQRGTRKEGLRPNWWYEEDGTPLDITDPVFSSPGFVLWHNQPLSGVSTEYFGYGTGVAVGIGESLGGWFTHDRQHWMSTWTDVDAIVSGDWWAEHMYQYLAHIWCSVQNVNSISPGIRINDSQPRGEGRPARIAAVLYELYSLPTLRQRIIDRLNQYDRTYEGKKVPRQSVGDLLMPYGVAGPDTTTLPVEQSITWMECIYVMGIYSLAQVLLRRTDDSAAIDAATKTLRIAREVSTTWALYGYWGNPEQTEQAYRINPSSASLFDRSLAGRRVTQSSSGATGILRFYIVDNGRHYMWISDCVGKFVSGGSAVTIQGDSRTFTILLDLGKYSSPAFYYPNHQFPNNVTGQGAFVPLDASTKYSLWPNPKTEWALRAGLFSTWHEYNEWAICIAAVCRDALRSSTFYSASVAARVKHIVDDLIANWKPTGAALFDNQTEFVALIEDVFNPNFINAPPAIPTNLTAVGTSTTEIAVNWQHNGQNVDGFRLEYKLSTETEWTLIALGPAARGRIISGLLSGKIYDNRIRAYNTFGESDNTPEVSASTLGIPKPNRPTGIFAVGIDSSRFRITFDDTNSSPNETHSILEESDNGTSGWVEIALIPADEIEKVVGDYAAETTKYFRLTNYIGSEASDPSDVVNATTLPAGGEPNPPDTPTGLNVTSSFAGSGIATVNLSFIPGVAGEPATHYEIRADVTGAGQWLSGWTGTAPNTSATISGLLPNTSYDFQVRALNSGGVSAWSDTVQTTTPQSAGGIEFLSPQENLAAVAISGIHVHLTWDDVELAEVSQELQRKNVLSGEDWELVAQIDPNIEFYDDKTVQPENQYQYRIRVISASGNISDWSNTADVTTPAIGEPGEKPNKITGITISVTNASADLTWVDTNIDPEEDGTIIQWQKTINGAAIPDNWLPSNTHTVGRNVTQNSIVGLLPNTQYAFRLAPFIGGTLGDWSDTAYATTDSDPIPTAPLAPTNLIVIPDITTADATWDDNASDEDTYHIELSPDGLAFIEVDQIEANSEAYTFADLAPNWVQYARVRCSKQGVVSEYSNTVQFKTNPGTGTGQPPAAPTTLIARAHRNKPEIHLHWRDNSSNELGFNVQRWHNDQNDWVTIATLSPNKESYIDKDIKSGELYIYRVLAFNANGFSPSNVATVVSSVITPVGRVKLNVRATYTPKNT